MSFINLGDVSRKSLKEKGYKRCYDSCSYERIGNSKYLYDVEYFIKDFNKYFEIKNNPFDDNDDKKVQQSVSFFFSAIADDLILYYHITGNNCNTEFKSFKIENCVRAIGGDSYYKKEYLLKARQDLEKFIVNFLDNNCIGIEVKLFHNRIQAMNKQKKIIDEDILRIKKAIEENYSKHEVAV